MSEQKPQGQDEMIKQAMKSQEKSAPKNSKPSTSGSSEGFGKGLEEMAAKVTEQLYQGLGKVLNPLIWFATAKNIFNSAVAHPLFTADKIAESTENRLRSFGK